MRHDGPGRYTLRMTTTHEELARRQRAWTEEWERQREEDDLDELAERLAAQQRHPAGKRRGQQ